MKLFMGLMGRGGEDGRVLNQDGMRDFLANRASGCFSIRYKTSLVSQLEEPG